MPLRKNFAFKERLRGSNGAGGSAPTLSASIAPVFWATPQDDRWNLSPWVRTRGPDGWVGAGVPLGCDWLRQGRYERPSLGGVVGPGADADTGIPVRGPA